MLHPRSLKGGIGLLLTPVLTLWGGGHVDCHIWRWVIVPPDLARSFSAIYAHYRDHVIHCTITYVHAWCKSMQKRQSRLMKLFGGLRCEKIRWYNNSPPYVTARWPPQQIPPLNFLDCITYFDPTCTWSVWWNEVHHSTVDGVLCSIMQWLDKGVGFIFPCNYVVIVYSTVGVEIFAQRYFCDIAVFRKCARINFPINYMHNSIGKGNFCVF